MRKLILSIMALAVLILSVPMEAQSQNKRTKEKQVKNVIYMIGDGMGLTQVTAAMLAKESPLALQDATYVGLQRTHSASSEVTDSAASGTALATGKKTYNGAIGMDENKQPVESVLTKSKKAGLATGVIATYSVTNATPASFVAHNESRGNEFEIAEDYLDSDIDVFIGGGVKFFEKREDGRNLSEELKAKGYTIGHSMDEVKNVTSGRLGALLADNAMPTIKQGRGNMLPEATAQALTILSNNSSKGFFLMVEGSQIDGGGHDNNPEKVVLELLDFDAAVKVAFEYADQHPGTLVVVTADHETGGLTLPEKDKKAVPEFSTKGHTGTMVPVYAYGTGASAFTGIMDNTDIPKKIEALMKLK